MNKRTLALFTGVILLLVLIAAATGIFYQTAGAHINFVTMRGEHATFQGYGLYYYDPASVAREGIIWDVIDLCLALPLFIVAIVFSWRGSLRGQLLLEGMLFYFFYKYMMFAVILSFNPLFLVYVAIFALSAVSFFLNLGGVKVSSLPAHISTDFPRWLFIVFTLLMSAALLVLWLGRIIPYTLAGRFPDLIGGTDDTGHTGIRSGHRSSLVDLDSSLTLGTLIWGYFLGGQPYIRVRDVHNPSRVDCCSIDSGWSDRSRRSRSIFTSLPDRVVCGRGILLERTDKEMVQAPRKMVLVS